MTARLELTLAAILLAGPAAADPVSRFTALGIEIDGDYMDDAGQAGEDWHPDFAPFSDPVGKLDQTLCATSPAPKNDLSNTFVANDFDYLYMAMERLANRGNTSFFFGFDITNDGPTRGDFIFVFCFGSGENVTDTYVLEYDEVREEFFRDATPPRVDFAVNTIRTLAPFGALDRHGRPTSVIEPGILGEARVDLDDIEGFDVCMADDVRLEIQTKSSCSLSSQCKDTSGPISFTFLPLTASLELRQPPGCAPEIVARANADSPRGSVTYRWFLDGEDITDRDPSWSTSDEIVIPLADECGPVEVGVIADDGECQVEDSGIVDVNRQPVAGIGTLDVGACDGVLTYSGFGSTDCNGSPLDYAWDFDGDGVVDSDAESGTFTYAGCGERQVSLVVADAECESEPVGQTVYVNQPPEAGLAIRPSGAHCLEIAFAVTSTDCDLGEVSDLYVERLEHETDFGDGSATSTEESGVHRYAACGTYVATTTTRDRSGCESQVQRIVEIDVVAEVE